MATKSRAPSISRQPASAPAKNLASSLLFEAKTELEKRIQEIASKAGDSVEFEYTPAPAVLRGN